MHACPTHHVANLAAVAPDSRGDLQAVIFPGPLKTSTLVRVRVRARVPSKARVFEAAARARERSDPSPPSPRARQAIFINETVRVMAFDFGVQDVPNAIERVAPEYWSRAVGRYVRYVRVLFRQS